MRLVAGLARRLKARQFGLLAFVLGALLIFDASSRRAQGERVRRSARTDADCSVSTAGWQMMMGADGSPRFERTADAGTPHPAAQTGGVVAARDHDDAYWSDRFFPVGMRDRTVNALAGDGSGILYGGGFFTTEGTKPSIFAADSSERKWMSTFFARIDVGTLRESKRLTLLK